MYFKNIKICNCLVPNLQNRSNFYTLEFVSRYRDPQLKVGGKYKKDNLAGKGSNTLPRNYIIINVDKRFLHMFVSLCQYIT